MAICERSWGDKCWPQQYKTKDGNTVCVLCWILLQDQWVYNKDADQRMQEIGKQETKEGLSWEENLQKLKSARDFSKDLKKEAKEANKEAAKAREK